MPDLATDTLKRWEQLQSDRRPYEGEWRSLAEVLLPRKKGLGTLRSPGGKKTEKLFDSTGPKAAFDLASVLHGYLTSPAIEWASLQTEDDVVNQEPDVRRWMEQATSRLHLAYNHSNFDTELPEAYLDVIVFGIAAIFTEETSPKSGSLRFRTLTLGEYVIDEDAEGMVDTLYRGFELTPRQAVQKFGDATLAESLRRAVEATPERRYAFIHAVEPKPPGDQGLPWRSLYLDVANKATIGPPGGYEEFPYLVPRWSKISGEVWGFGLGHLALPDIKTLNEAVKQNLRAWAKIIDPPMQRVEDGVGGPLDLTPGAENIVGKTGNIAPIEFGSKFQVAQIESAELRERVRGIFFAEQLTLKESPAMTALEVSVRYQLLQRLLGPTLGRFKAELHTPLIKRTFGLLYRAGVFATPPEALAVYLMKGGRTRISYEGPLERASRSQDLVAIQQLAAFIAGIQPIAPEVVDKVDFDQAVEEVATISGAPLTILRTPEALQALRGARQEKQAQDEMAAAATQAAESGGKVAPLLKALAGGAPPVGGTMR